MAAVMKRRLLAEEVSMRAAFAALPGADAATAVEAWRRFWWEVVPWDIIALRPGDKSETMDPDAFNRFAEPELASASECWPWPGSLGGGTKGQVSLRGWRGAPQRAAVALSLGLDLRGPWVGGCIVCDLGHCCNPWHLMAVSAGTRSGDDWAVAGDLTKKPRTSPRMAVGTAAFSVDVEVLASELGLLPERVEELRERSRAAAARAGRGTPSLSLPRQAEEGTMDEPMDEFTRKMLAIQRAREAR